MIKSYGKTPRARRRKAIRFEMGWSVCASLIYHALIFFVLSKTSLNYPAFGTVARFDLLWVSPVSAPLALPAADEAAPPSTDSADSAQSPLPSDPAWDEPESAVPPRETAEDEGRLAPLVSAKDSSSAGRVHKQSEKPRQGQQSPQKVPVPDPPSAPITAVSHRVEEPLQEIQEPAKVTLAQSQQALAQFSSAKTAKPDMQRANLQNEQKLQDEKKQLARLEAFQQLQNEQAQALALAERMGLKAERERISQQRRVKKEEKERELKAAREAEQKRAAQQRRVKKEEEERALQAAKSVRFEKMERAAEQKRVAQQQKMAQDMVERELKTAERARLERMKREAERESFAQQQRVKREEEQVLDAVKRARLDQEKKEAATRDRAAARLESVVPAAKETTGPKPSDEPQEKRGMVVPSVHGDLKLVIAENDDLQVLVTFTSYPKSRRGRPLTKNEARREQKILPILGKTQEGKREAVIETAREGIYVFSVDSGGGKATTASFTLKIFELSTKKRIKELGARKFSGKTVLLKILMPEAILWEDESAFTGSMEDSESVLKFNAETGLNWKEYKEPI